MTALDAVVVSELVKTFGATRALKGISMTIPTGEISALVGENGAGKSTALGLMAGRISPTSGRIEIFGKELAYGSPIACRNAGVVAIYQELTIIPALSPAANVFLANPMTRLGLLSERAMQQRYEQLCETVGVGVAPRGYLAGKLSVAEQQILEILRALATDAQLILFDEPTAALAQPERDALFRLMRSLREAGKTLVFVSHNLEEVLSIADEITVFRDGSIVDSAPAQAFTKKTLVKAMLGDAGAASVAAEMQAETGGPSQEAVRVRRSTRTGGPLIAVSGASVPGVLQGVDLEIHAGEVVGVGGLVGSGRSTLLRALAGQIPTSRGRMWIDGAEVAWPRTVRRSLGYGIAFIPEDRKKQGLVLNMSAAENIVMSDYSRVASRGVISRRALERAAREEGAAFGLARKHLRARAAHLSGGNQQKLLLARWKHSPPRVLLADEPTRGIDVGAKAEVLATLTSSAADGLAILFCSSELAEVAAIAERVVVLCEGLYVGTLDAAKEPISPHSILDLAFRVDDTSHVGV